MPYTYLPSTVTFRFTDILRGYIAQRCFWAHDMHLGFSAANVYQERNEHDLSKDLDSEMIMYKCIDELIGILNDCKLSGDQKENLIIIYEQLAAHKIVELLELEILHRWLNCMPK